MHFFVVLLACKSVDRSTFCNQCLSPLQNVSNVVISNLTQSVHDKICIGMHWGVRLDWRYRAEKFSGLDWFMVFNATFNNILVISWRSVLLVEVTGVPGETSQ